ncbi:hypothetical protein [Jannaschia aquimarina]|uniref:YARHG domain-containing protein n=1 Tax=Jannaschia aquimarina TaxID=935700 RepID=A0A0D1D5X1_9RHOB|nr:hypothetical protein [Jannaschia aquimarina]KIT15358.1 hypothetical protein jaqu_29730 [Jannaschia aquimarina]SNS52016.1 hypothetical protein SAMN05421775_101287 [Jannaschia aquimarina]
MIRTILVVLATALVSPAWAEPNSQLVASVQQRLDRLGFDGVDARQLSTRQIAALHMRLQGPTFGGFGFNDRWMKKRREVKAILRWEEEGRPSY